MILFCTLHIPELIVLLLLVLTWTYGLIPYDWGRIMECLQFLYKSTVLLQNNIEKTRNSNFMFIMAFIRGIIFKIFQLFLSYLLINICHFRLFLVFSINIDKY